MQHLTWLGHTSGRITLNTLNLLSGSLNTHHWYIELAKVEESYLIDWRYLLGGYLSREAKGMREPSSMSSGAHSSRWEKVNQSDVRFLRDLPGRVLPAIP